MDDWFYDEGEAREEVEAKVGNSNLESNILFSFRLLMRKGFWNFLSGNRSPIFMILNQGDKWSRPGGLLF